MFVHAIHRSSGYFMLIRAVAVFFIGSLAAIVGCRQSPAPQPTDRSVLDEPCPYKLTLTPAKAERENLAVNLTVENISDKPVGWDSEFAAGIGFTVQAVRDPSDAGEAGQPPREWL